MLKGGVQEEDCWDLCDSISACLAVTHNLSGNGCELLYVTHPESDYPAGKIILQKWDLKVLAFSPTMLTVAATAAPSSAMKCYVCWALLHY